MDKLTSMISDAAGGAGGDKLAAMAGGDPGESLEQTAKEKMVETQLHNKVEELAGAKAAENKQVKEGIEKIADAIGDKVPTSMLGAAGMASLGGASEGEKNQGGDQVSGLMEQAQGFLGK
jgi:hypothetical protein